MTNGNLLLVDDEIRLLHPLRMLLSSYADNIFEAHDGLEALEILAKEKIHCVLSDIQMPRMTGLSLIKTLREQGNNVPFIFYSGNGNRELMLEASQFSAFDFLNKPDLNGLEEMVQKGLKAGVSPIKFVTQFDYISEYQKLIKEI
jgi:YesN/AraC family two-component response regulator